MMQTMTMFITFLEREPIISKKVLILFVKN
jgi:hypothetical protein